MSAFPLLDAARRVRRPTIFLPGLPAREPIECLTLPAALEQIRALANGRPLTFTEAAIAYPDFEPTLAISVRAAGEWIASLANLWNEPARTTALATLRAQA